MEKLLEEHLQFWVNLYKKVGKSDIEAKLLAYFKVKEMIEDLGLTTP